MRVRLPYALTSSILRSSIPSTFDRQQYAFALGGPLKKDRAFWFGAFEYRNQDGAVLVGERDLTTRTIRRNFAAAPLDDLLGIARADWRPSDNDQFSFRYAIERADDVAASTLERSIGFATTEQRQRLPIFLEQLDARHHACDSQQFHFQRHQLRQPHAARPAARLSLAARRRIVPCAATQRGWAIVQKGC